MKYFLKYIVIFLIPILIIAITIEVLVRYIPNRYKLQANYLETHAKDVETIIIGSSHTLYGINPEFIDGQVFNSSNVSQTLDLDLEILKHYEQDFKKLKNVVIRLSYTTLFEKLVESNEKWRMKDYVIYHNIQNGFSISNNSELISVKFKSNLKRIYEYYIQNKNTLYTNDLGWGTDANSSNSKDLVKTGVIIAKKHTIKDQSLFYENLKTLDAIVAFCKRKNFKIFLVTLPAYESYTNNLDPQQLNKTINTAQQIADINSNCSYSNFLKNNLFVDSDFFDADHLNEKGATKFSLIINKLLKH